MASRWRRWPASVRRNTAASAALLCLIVFVAGGLGIRQFFSTQLTANAIDATRADLDRMADAYRAASLGGGRAALTSSRLGGDAMFAVVTDTGRTVTRSAALHRLAPEWEPLPPAPAGAPPDWTTTTTTTLLPGAHPQWREYRTYTVVGRVIEDVPSDLVEPLGRAGPDLDSGVATAGSTQQSPRHRLTLYLFVPPWDALRTLSLFDDTVTGFVPLAVLLSALAAWFAAGRALRPVEAIRHELAEVSQSQFHRRVPVPRSRDEIARLARTTNETLDRLQYAYEQQERFVADASHELRSPLANLWTGLEVALAHPERADWPAVAHRSLCDVQRLQHITADLLHLAAAPSQAPALSVVDLADVVLEQVAERSAASGGPVVRALVDGPAPVRGVPMQLERLLRNLLDNAIRHARSSVTVTTAAAAGTIVLEVLDDGAGIPAADRERVFDRFTRLDDARARDAGGSGLGLALARDIATRHGGSLRVEPSDTGARLTARLPSTRIEDVTSDG